MGPSREMQQMGAMMGERRKRWMDADVGRRRMGASRGVRRYEAGRGVVGVPR